MKRFSVTAISPTLRKLGSLLFIFLILCGVGQQATELAKLHCEQVNGVCTQAGINQASIFVSSGYLAMPRTADLIKDLRHSESFQLLLALLLNLDVAPPSVRSLSLWNSANIPSQLGRNYGMLPLPNAPPARS